MSEIKKIVNEILKGNLTREVDESYQKGFWDLSKEIIFPFEHLLMQEDYESIQEEIYNHFWEIAENFTKKINSKKYGNNKR